MIAYAEHEFKLDETDKNGSSLRQTLEVVHKQTGRRPDDLENPIDLPFFMFEIWDMFQMLCQSRQVGMSLNPITYNEIQSYLEIIGKRINKLELLAIKRLDAAFLKHIGKNK